MIDLPEACLLEGGVLQRKSVQPVAGPSCKQAGRSHRISAGMHAAAVDGIDQDNASGEKLLPPG